MDFLSLLFYGFAGLLLLSAICVVTARNPVRGVLFLVLAFFASACLWLLLEAEFLALVLILVYVGAVMTLFLFVVMMLNINRAAKQQGFVRYLPFGGIIIALTVGMMVTMLRPDHLPSAVLSSPVRHSADYSNIKALAVVLYTDYLYSFEIAGVLLLVAIIAAIGLAFRGRRRQHGENISRQVSVRRQDRVRIVKMASERPSGANKEDDAQAGEQA